MPDQPTHHPIQPLVRITPDSNALKFKPNAIVRYLLDTGGTDMNRLSLMQFSDEDRQQFAQLIGYSLSGYGELSYVDDAAYAAAAELAKAMGR